MVAPKMKGGPQRKECRQPLQAGQGKETEEVCRRSTVLLTSLFWPSEDPFWVSVVQNWEEINLCCLSHYICGNLLRQERK